MVAVLVGCVVGVAADAVTAAVPAALFQFSRLPQPGVKMPIITV